MQQKRARSQYDQCSFKDNLSFKVNETANPLQSLLLNVVGSFAQFEREIIVERTSEGRKRCAEDCRNLVAG
ncbi:recombinase family protein [Metabacillus sp. CT-WN-B3]|uniref:Recombinase family protein n=1 Tax=Metabacillus hrfriensis TaxID=3048891 RepID=A0ACD4RIE2_9BACI|nr:MULTISPECIES: recombinase family protein [Metabacillus]UOK59847.1 recombinase family protein [Bacillus sp. OVS6]USK31006.1 recombinase family protein [Bacillus sp. CMF21]WHZ60236.1 recombinase family protein [Metabacillus sp. CT-WN-B3]